MINYELWDLKNEFTLKEVVRLWLGLDPYDGAFLNEYYTDIKVFNDILCAALKTVTCKNKIDEYYRYRPPWISTSSGFAFAWQRPASSYSGNLPPDYRIDRQSLIEYAIKINQKPAFLFPEVRTRQEPSPQTKPKEVISLPILEKQGQSNGQGMPGSTLQTQNKPVFFDDQKGYLWFDKNKVAPLEPEDARVLKCMTDIIVGNNRGFCRKEELVFEAYGKNINLTASIPTDIDSKLNSWKSTVNRICKANLSIQELIKKDGVRCLKFSIKPKISKF